MKRTKPIAEFQSLTQAQKDQIFTWWSEDGVAYDKMRVRIREQFGVDITKQKIQRQCERWFLAEELQTTEENLLALLDGDQVDFSAEGLKAILQKAFILLARGDHSPSALKMLQNIFDYQHRRELRLNRDTRAGTMVQIAQERLELAKRSDARAERALDHKIEQSKSRRRREESHSSSESPISGENCTPDS